LNLNNFLQFDNLFGYVTYEPVLIKLPQYIRVPYKGSSLPQKIVINSRPYNDIELLFLIDFNKFEEDIMIDSDYSSPSMKFTYE